MFKLSETELDTLLDEMDRHAGVWSGDDRREQERFRYRYRLTVIMLVHGSTTEVPHAVMGRNVSRNGFEFLTDEPARRPGCRLLASSSVTRAHGALQFG